MSGQKGRPSIRWGAMALLWLCAFGIRSAAAQQPAVAPAAQPSAPAQQHLGTGRAALAKGDLTLAQRELELAYQLNAGPELLGLLGQVAARQGQRTRAADLFRRYLAETSVAEADSAALLALIQSEQDKAAEVVVAGAAGALLRVDDRIAGRLPLSRLLLMTPGPHRLALELDGQRKVHLVKAASGIPVSVRFTEDRASLVDAIETRPAVVLFLYDQQLKLPPAPLARAILDRVRLDGQAYDLAAERVERGLAKQPAGCLTQLPCLLRLARTLGVDYILQVRREATSYAVQVRDVAVDLSTASPQRVDCSGREEVACAAALRDAVGELLTPSLSRQHGRLRISSRPAGAAVVVDEQPLDRPTPHELALFAGDHRITLRKSGYVTQRAPATVTADALTELALDLKTDLAAQRQRRFAIGKRVLAVVGALAIAGGAVAIGVNGITRDDATDASRYEELLSWPHGVAAIAVGVVAGGLAIWLHRKEGLAAREVRAAEQ